MSDEDKTFSGSFVLDMRIWWCQARTLYTVQYNLYCQCNQNVFNVNLEALFYLNIEFNYNFKKIY